MKFNDLFLVYFDYCLLRQKPQSIRTLRERFNNVIIPYFGDYNIDSISKTDYLIFQNNLFSKHYSYNYIKNIHYYLCGFYNFLINYSYIDSNIFKSTGLVINKDHNNYCDNFYTLSEFNRFIKFVDNPLYRTFFLTLFYTGVRPGELMALKCNDLSFHSIRINKTIDEHGSRLISSPKTFSSIRSISIPIFLYLDLRRFYSSDDNFLFGGIKPLSPTTINRYKVIACNKAKLKPITLHGFRHSHATLLLDRGLSIKAISKRLGHSSSDVTLNIYSHLTDRQEKKVYKTLNFLSIFSYLTSYRNKLKLYILKFHH